MEDNIKLALDCVKLNKSLDESINQLKKLESVLAKSFEFQALGIAVNLEKALKELQINNNKALYYHNVLDDALNNIIDKYKGK